MVFCVIFHGVNKRVKGRNVESNKMEARRRVQHFFVHVFKYIYCKLVVHVGGGRHGSYFVIPQKLIDQFVFIWGRERCSLTLSQS
jgi:hypothetical protein